MKLAHLSWHKAEPILKNPDTLVVIPVGSTEQHGPVGPLGTDWLIPEWIADEIEKRCDILVTPVVPFGVATHHTSLPGTIDMGRSSDWQAALVARFRDSIGGRWLFFNPRRREFHASPAEMEYQVAWELAHLEAADLIVMNLLGDSRSPISLLEMGLYARSGKLFVACSPDYYRYDNVRITCRRYGVPLYDSLTALLDDLPQQSDE